MVEIREVKTQKDLKAFILFPLSLYKGNPHWIPDLILDELDNLQKEKNPAFDYCDLKLFLALREGKIVGRIGAIVNKKSNATWGQNRLRFTRPDFFDDNEVVDALFDAVEDWAREQGLNEVHGPMGFTDLDKEGMLVEGFDQVGTFITYYNHPYYPEQLARRGYVKDIDWVEYKLTIPSAVNEKIDRLSEIIMRRQKLTFFNYKNKKELATKFEELFDLINESYEHLYGVVELTRKQIQHYVKQYLPLVESDFLKMILDKNGKVCAFGLGLPSVDSAIQKSRGHLFPFGLFQMLHELKHNKVLILLLIAVRPDLQGTGLAAALLNEFTKSAISRGMIYAESSPELETNEKVQALWKGIDAQQHKRRRCYIKAL